jgi:hypothetical protein
VALSVKGSEAPSETDSVPAPNGEKEPISTGAVDEHDKAHSYPPALKRAAAAVTARPGRWVIVDFENCFETEFENGEI